MTWLGAWNLSEGRRIANVWSGLARDGGMSADTAIAGKPAPTLIESLFYSANGK